MIDSPDRDWPAGEGSRTEPESLRHLVDLHGRYLYRLAYRVLGHPQDAEDAVQEAFLRAFKSLDRYDRSASFRAWISRITMNHCLDVLRRRRWQAPMPSSGDDRPAFEPTAGEACPERLARSSEVRVRLREGLSQLTEQERTAFLMRHCEGEPIATIASALGTSQGAAKNCVFRAVQKLRRRLEPLMGGAA